MIGIEIEMVKQVSKVTVVLAKRSKLGADAYCQEHLLYIRPSKALLWADLDKNRHGAHIWTASEDMQASR